MNKKKNLGVRLSIYINEKFGGKRGYTICATLWVGRLQGCPLSTRLVPIIDRVFFDKDHCREAWLNA